MVFSVARLFIGCWLLTWFSVPATEPTAHWPTGNPECPCIDPWTRGLQSNPVASQLGCDITRAGDHYCYTATFGSQGCQRYDWHATPECARSARDTWCGAMWCFVDGKQCSRPFKESTFFPNMTIGPGSEPLVYSYATCGYVDSFSPVDSVRPLLEAASSRPSGRLRVGFPSDSGSGYTVVSPPKVEPFQGVGGTNRSGSFLLFMADIFEDHGIPWEEAPVSLRSQEFSPNSQWTACVHEVAIGNIDMCWGNFWPTASRQSLTSFATPVYFDRFHVVIYKRNTDISVWNSLVKPFTPFTPMLWMVLLLVFGYAGVTMTYQNAEKKISPVGLFFMIPSSIMRGWHAMFSSEIDGIEITSIGGWFGALAIGFAVLVLFTGYTAVVTTDLMTAKQGSIENIHEGIQKSFRFCSNVVLKDPILAQYPDLQPLLVDAALVDALDLMDEGACDAAIIQEDLWYNLRIGNTRHCEGDKTKLKLPTAIASIANTIPVRPELVASVSWMISREVETGSYIRYRRQGQLQYRLPACAESTFQAEKSQFTVWDMAGPCIILGIISTVSVVITFITKRIKRKAEEIASSLDEDGDGEVTTSEVVHAMIKNGLGIRNSFGQKLKSTDTRSEGQPQAAHPGTLELPEATETIGV